MLRNPFWMLRNPFWMLRTALHSLRSQQASPKVVILNPEGVKDLALIYNSAPEFVAW